MGKLSLERVVIKVLDWVLAVIVAVLLSAATFAIVDVVIMGQYQKDFRKVAVTGETIPELFPVLVITPSPKVGEYNAKTLLYKNLDDYLSKHKEYSFLVPEGREEQLNAELKRNSRASNETWDSTHPWWAYFEVEQLSDERQYLMVYHTWDDYRDNASWYEATTKEIFPRYHQYYRGPYIPFNMTLILFFINGALWIACFIVYKLFRKRAKRSSQLQVESD